MPRPTVSTVFNAVDRTSPAVKKMQQTVKRFAVAAGASMIAATAAAVRGTVKLAEAGDEIAKTSRKIGVSAEGLQELRFAADRSGVSASTLDGALEKLNKNVGDLRANTGALTTYLNKSNPALAEQLKNVETNEEAFAILSDELANITNPMDRAALAQAAFGRAGQDLIVMTENGTKGIEELREEARKYGNIISNEAAGGSEVFVDAMTNMRAAIAGVKNKALVPMINTFTPLIQKMADWVAANQDLINQKITEFIQGVVKGGKALWRLWDNGVIPAILAGVVAFKAITGAMAAFKSIMAIAKGVQIAFNAAVLANPIGLIIAAIAAFIALVVIAIKHFDTFGSALLFIMGPVGQLINLVMHLRANWDAVKASFADGGFLSGLKTLGLVLINSVLIPLQQIMGMVQKVIMTISGGKLGGKIGDKLGGLISRNQGVIESNSTTTNNSTVDVNFGNLPAGSTVKQSGNAPGVSLRTGYGGYGL